MTRDETVSRVRNNLADAGITFYKDQQIIDSIQDGYDEAVTISRPLEKMVTIPFQDNLVYYDLYELISDFISVLAIYNQNNKTWLQAESIRYFEDIRENWELANGNPLYFAPVNFRFVALYPRLATASGAMDVYYKAKAPQLIGSDELQITEWHPTLIENYATCDGLEQGDEFVKAQQYFSSYIENLNNARESITNRNLIDRMMMLQPGGINPPLATGGGGLLVSGGGEVAIDFVDNETPSGTINGVNDIFTLTFSPNPSDSLELILNGQVQARNVDYSLSGSTITFVTAKIPQSGDILRAWYRR